MNMNLFSPQQIQAQFSAEWRRILDDYFPRANLPVPVFLLLNQEESGRMLGAWWGIGRNTIGISWDLICHHPWYAVLEVFRHEVAHALTDYFYPQSVDGEPPHGPSFRIICHRIGANPSAVVDQTALDQRVFQDPSENGATEEEGAVSRIRKLLTLADAASDHEAEVALCKAQQLMAKSGISREDLEREEYTSITVGEPTRRITAERKMLAAILQKFWPVELIWGFAPGDEKTNYLLYVCGTINHVRIASYVYDFIVHRIDHEFKMRFATRGIRSRDKKNFAMGVLDGLYQALSKQSQTVEECALILSKPAELEDYYGRRFARTRKLQNSYRPTDEQAYSEGKEVGQKMHISDGLDQNSPSRRFLNS